MSSARHNANGSTNAWAGRDSSNRGYLQCVSGSENHRSDDLYARAFVLKGHVLDELLDTIRAVHAGKKRIPPDVAAALADHAIDDALTEREIDVLRLIAGNGNKQIADELSISEATVKSRVTNILSKLGANDRTHAVTIGLKRGIIELDPSQK